MIDLEIVTPEKKAVDQSVEMVTVPTAKGEIGILADHAPLISILKPGILTFSEKGSTEKIVVSGGFVEVSGNRVSILADIAEGKSEIDVESARTEQEEIQKVLGEWKGTEEEFEIEFERFEKARARLELASAK